MQDCQQYMRKNKLVLFVIWLTIQTCAIALCAQPPHQNEISTLQGKIVRSDTNQPVIGATVILYPYQWQGARLIKSITDEKGNYSFPQLRSGKYKIDIEIRYKTIADSPCNLAKKIVTEKNANVTMKDESLGWFDLYVSIDPFTITGKKQIKKDFDIACKSFEKKHK